MKQRARTRSGRKVALPLLIILLSGSAALRIGGESGGLAFARDATHTEVASAERIEDAAPPPDEGELGMLITRLKAREADLDRREQALVTRQAQVQRLSQEVETRLAELARAEETLRQTMALADEAAENDLSRLTQVYENMKPREASALFATMEPSFAAGFLGRMKPASAAAILQGLPPNFAYAVSLTLSGRNLEAPTR